MDLPDNILECGKEGFNDLIWQNFEYHIPILNSILNVVHRNLIAQTAKVKLTLKFYKIHIGHTL